MYYLMHQEYMEKVSSQIPGKIVTISQECN